MLYVVPVKESKPSFLPAITHVDGTGRLQTVFREHSPHYYALIERFGQSTGVPVVLNTSFSLKGEPVVNTPANAFQTFLKSEPDALVPSQGKSQWLKEWPAACPCSSFHFPGCALFCKLRAQAFGYSVRRQTVAQFIRVLIDGTHY